MVQGTGAAENAGDELFTDIESAKGIGPPPPPPTREPDDNHSPFTPDHPEQYNNNIPTKQKPQIDLEAVKLSEEDVREALATWVLAQDGCCVDKSPLREMIITEINPVMAVHYKLETFTEWRGTGWTSCPYYGGQVDGPENGTTPGGWDIDVEPDEPFSNHVKTREMPHTASLSMCHKCQGGGSERCNHCAGSGAKTCSSCMGKGTKKHRVKRGEDYVYEEQQCSSCTNGMQRCSWCSGKGTRTCSGCSGRGQVKRFLQLFIKFKNDVKDYVHNDPSFPDELVADVEGDILFKETGMQVEPMKDFPQEEILKASRDLIAQYNRERYQQDSESERQLQQRQVVKGVPISVVRYRYKGISHRFWVYSKQRKVHCPDYPKSACAKLCGWCIEKKENSKKCAGGIVGISVTVIAWLVIIVFVFL